MQVDWVSGVLTPGPLWPVGVRMYDTGRVLVLGPGGELSFEKAGAVAVEGSHDNRLRVASPDGATLWLSGNPAKFFQGHNLFGSVDHAGLFLAGGIAVRQKLGLFPGPATAEGFERPRWTRLDLTRSYRFPDDAMARAWLRDGASSARTRHGGAVVREGTVYWGKGSERWGMKAYLKSDELSARGKGHALSERLPEPVRRELRDWAAGVVRFELQLRSKELQKLGLERAATLDAEALWSQYWARVQWNRNVDVVEGLDMVDDVALPVYLEGYLARWLRGVDLREELSRPTFYRVRSALLRAAGVDIASAPPHRENGPQAASQRVSAALDPAGWDPEPLRAHLFEPDADGDLKRAYKLL
jgi:hypothetical protein